MAPQARRRTATLAEVLDPEDIAVPIPSSATEEAAASTLMGDIANTFGGLLFNFPHFVMARGPCRQLSRS